MEARKAGGRGEGHGKRDRVKRGYRDVLQQASYICRAKIF